MHLSAWQHGRWRKKVYFAASIPVQTSTAPWVFVDSIQAFLDLKAESDNATSKVAKVTERLVKLLLNQIHGLELAYFQRIWVAII